MATNPILPPHDTDAEKNLISSVLLDREALIKAAEMIDALDFYDPVYQTIFSSCLDLFENSSAVDIITVKADLSKKNELKKIGGAKVLAELAAVLPITTNVEHYARIIRENSVRRKLIATSSELLSIVTDEKRKIEEIVNEVEKRFFAVLQKSKDRGFSHIKDVLVRNLEKYNEMQGNSGSMRGISTGYQGLNNLLGGFHNGDLIIIAARPAVGKTAFILGVARHIAVELKKKVGIFSLEMSMEQLGDRLASLQGGVNLMDIRMGNLANDDFIKYNDALGTLYDADIYIVDTPGLHISEMRTKARKLDLEVGIDILFVDYLQLLKATSKDGNRAQEVTEISQSLKNLARELNIPVIALSQLNRSVEARNDRRPQLSDLRESGSIEQDADIVMFLHRESTYNRDLSDEEKDKAEVIVAKHRNGATDIITMKFIPQYAAFVDAPQ